MQTDSDNNFRSCLASPGYRLSCFQTSDPRNFFPVCRSYPPFFHDNLVSPSRSIRRLLNNYQGALRIFYYQLLKICFELQVGQSMSVIKHFKNRVFQKDFRIDLRETITQSGFDRMEVMTDGQCKKILAEFLQIVSSEIEPDCEEFVGRFPVVDTILVAVLDNMVGRGSSLQGIFGKLADQFGLSVTLIGNCFKFDDSDMFCYVEPDSDYIYLAFMDSSFSQQQANQNYTLDPIQQISGSESGTRRTNEHNTSLAYSATNEIEEDVRINAVNSHSPLIKHTDYSEILKDSVEKRFYTPRQNEMKDFYGDYEGFNNGYQKTQKATDSTILDRSFERIKGQLEDRKLAAKLTSSDFYRQNPPSMNTLHPYSNPPYLQHPSSSPYYYFPAPTKYPLDFYQPNQSRGDYYEDFTKTFLLDSMEQPFRTNIRSIKDNVRGMRRPVATSGSSVFGI